MKAIDDRSFLEVPVVENVTPPVPPSAVQPATIADVRDVPLEELPGDTDVRQMVSRVIGIMGDSSRIRVAMFNSAI